jgi:hypothetical protein
MDAALWTQVVGGSSGVTPTSIASGQTTYTYFAQAVRAWLVKITPTSGSSWRALNVDVLIEDPAV